MNAPSDLTLTCIEPNCRAQFIHSVRDQEFFASKGYTPPKRCKSCVAANKARRAGETPQAPAFGSYSTSAPPTPATSKYVEFVGGEGKKPRSTKGRRNNERDEY
jgi:hypothetical protein